MWPPIHAEIILPPSTGLIPENSSTQAERQRFKQDTSQGEITQPSFSDQGPSKPPTPKSFLDIGWKRKKEKKKKQNRKIALDREDYFKAVVSPKTFYTKKTKPKVGNESSTDTPPSVYSEGNVAYCLHHVPFGCTCMRGGQAHTAARLGSVRRRGFRCDDNARRLLLPDWPPQWGRRSPPP